MSTTVDQAILSDPDTDAVGDCWRACIATILGLASEDVPHFVQDSEDLWLEATVDWLAERGFALLHIAEDDLVSWLGEPLWIKTGESPRGPALRHAVVMRGGSLWHDPHPSREGLSGGPYYYWAIVIGAVPETV